MGGCLLVLLFGCIGYFLTGSVGGAFLGMVLGSFFNTDKKTYNTHSARSQNIAGEMTETLLHAIVQLSVVVIKADNKMMRSELYLFRDFILQNFGQEVASDAITYLQEIKDENISAEEACEVLNENLNYTEKMQILRFLFQLAYVDESINNNETAYISHIASLLQIRQHDYIYMRATFEYTQKSRYQYRQQSSGAYVNESKLDRAYAVLGVKSTDDNETIKKAYRSLAVANHPDKVQHLGETARQAAERRFSEISEAYNEIKKARNL